MRAWQRGVRIALVAIGAAVMPIGHSGAAEADSLTLLSPGLGCGPAEGAIGTSLLAQVRDARQRPQRQAAKPRRARPTEAPGAAQREEAPAHLLRAFYTCIGTTPAPVRMGMGWMAVGPVRRS